MEIPNLDIFSQKSRDTYINYVYFKSKIMNMRSRCPISKWLTKVTVQYQSVIATHFVHTKGTVTTLLQINVPKASLNFPINLSPLCYKYLIIVKEKLFHFDEWHFLKWNFQSLMSTVLKTVIFHIPVREVRRMTAAVTERVQRLSGFLRKWHCDIVHIQPLKVVIINALYDTYIAGRELCSVRSVC